MRRRKEGLSTGDFFEEDALVSYYRIVKRTIQDYSNAIMRHCMYKSVVSQTYDGTVLDDRSDLIDLYDSCYTQDAHLMGVMETLFAYMIDRYMLARHTDKDKWERDHDASEKIQGSQFEKIIREVLLSEFYGYSLLEISPEVDEETGRLKEVNSIERRNVLPNQHRVVVHQHEWDKGYDIDDQQYKHFYVLVNTGGLGIFSATTPLILAKKYTIANWVNFAHTYGQPIIHGKTNSEVQSDRARLAQNIASAAQKKVLVTGKEDEIDIKTFTMSNSEHIYNSLKNHANSEVSNLILGSESMAGETQAYVGSTRAHADILRARVKKYRRIVTNVMNEKVLPILKYWEFIPQDVYFCYSNKIEMSDENKIKLYDMLTNKYHIDPEVIEEEFGIVVGEQFNTERYVHTTGTVSGLDGDDDDMHRMSDEEYFKRYGHYRNKVNFLEGK